MKGVLVFCSYFPRRNIAKCRSNLRKDPEKKYVLSNVSFFDTSLYCVNAIFSGRASGLKCIIIRQLNSRPSSLRVGQTVAGMSILAIMLLESGIGLTGYGMDLLQSIIEACIMCRIIQLDAFQ